MRSGLPSTAKAIVFALAPSFVHAAEGETTCSCGDWTIYVNTICIVMLTVLAMVWVGTRRERTADEEYHNGIYVDHDNQYWHTTHRCRRIQADEISCRLRCLECWHPQSDLEEEYKQRVTETRRDRDAYDAWFAEYGYVDDEGVERDRADDETAPLSPTSNAHEDVDMDEEARSSTDGA
jgi:hypothetical protein